MKYFLPMTMHIIISLFVISSRTVANGQFHWSLATVDSEWLEHTLHMAYGICLWYRIDAFNVYLHMKNHCLIISVNFAFKKMDSIRFELLDLSIGRNRARPDDQVQAWVWLNSVTIIASYQWGEAKNQSEPSNAFARSSNFHPYEACLWGGKNEEDVESFPQKINMRHICSQQMKEEDTRILDSHSEWTTPWNEQRKNQQQQSDSWAKQYIYIYIYMWDSAPDSAVGYYTVFYVNFSDFMWICVVGWLARCYTVNTVVFKLHSASYECIILLF